MFSYTSVIHAVASSAVSKDLCTSSDFVNDLEYQQLDTAAQTIGTPGTWLFPSLKFNCSGVISGWVFRARVINSESRRVPQIDIWQLTAEGKYLLRSRSGSLPEEYALSSDESGNSVKGALTLSHGVRVEPGYIVGITNPVELGAPKLLFEVYSIDGRLLSHHQSATNIKEFIIRDRRTSTRYHTPLLRVKFRE